MLLLIEQITVPFCCLTNVSTSLICVELVCIDVHTLPTFKTKTRGKTCTLGFNWFNKRPKHAAGHRKRMAQVLVTGAQSPDYTEKRTWCNIEKSLCCANSNQPLKANPHVYIYYSVKMSPLLISHENVISHRKQSNLSWTDNKVYQFGYVWLYEYEILYYEIFPSSRSFTPFPSPPLPSWTCG